MEGKENRQAKTTLKKNKFKELTLLDFKMFQTSTLMKTMWY